MFIVTPATNLTQAQMY